MKANEMKMKLDAMGISSSMYAINDAEYPNEAYVLLFTGTKWEVYYSEKGKKRGLRTYVNESEACEQFMKQILAGKNIV